MPNNQFTYLIKVIAVSDVLSAFAALVDVLFHLCDMDNKYVYGVTRAVYTLSTNMFLVLASALAITALYIVRYGGSIHNVPWILFSLLSISLSLPQMLFAYFKNGKGTKVINIMDLTLDIVLFLVTMFCYLATYHQLRMSKEARRLRLSKNTFYKQETTLHAGSNAMMKFSITFTMVNLFIFIPTIVLNMLLVLHQTKVLKGKYGYFNFFGPVGVYQTFFSIKGVLHAIGIYYGFNNKKILKSPEKKIAKEKPLPKKDDLYISMPIPLKTKEVDAPKIEALPGSFTGALSPIWDTSKASGKLDKDLQLSKKFLSMTTSASTIRVEEKSKPLMLDSPTVSKFPDFSNM
ncbi:hypothetical protein HK103_003082 [Boothiomyces macroporosus]|uniref:Uncharacterized protein n=1 Tax=Boothiomyces macroporosus TaxID=261099 RepID=A0AAD5Y4C1_9FUNG|nr:hypothetical protein HK103_003082 [Boothiomyces macroporosus]